MLDKTLFELLADAGVPRLKSYAPGATEKLVCPRCGGGRTKDHCLSVTIGSDGMSAMWQCHRGNCDGFSGKVVVRERRAQSEPRPGPPPEGKYAGPFSRSYERNPEIQPEWFWKFWDDRHIGAKTLRHFGVYASNRKDLGDCIVFPYVWQGKQVNRKFRAYPNKDFRNEAGSTPTIYNIDAVVADQPLYWVEGEIDVMSMHEAGYPATVSLRDGAPQKVGQGDKRFEALHTHAEILATASEHILCPDSDSPGDAWLEELSRRLGRHKCRFVRWPKGRKDASDTLRMASEVGFDDAQAISIHSAIADARRFPLEGVLDLTPEVIDFAFTRTHPGVLTLGVSGIDDRLKFPAEGKLIVITGVPSHGKSTFMRFVAVRTIMRHKRRWLAFVQEDDFEDYVIDCTKIHAERAFTEIRPEDRKSAGKLFMNGALRILQFDGERSAPTMDKIFERARFSILQDGTTDLLIDPFNEVEDAYEHGTMTQTQHIGRTLQRAKAFARENSCNVWIVAHPAKPQGYERKPPDGYDCAGSANWANKPDLGFTVWRPGAAGDVELHIWKSRTQRWGVSNSMTSAFFKADTGTYHQPIKPETTPKDPPKGSYYERNEDADEQFSA
jgi:twinkle protein